MTPKPYKTRIKRQFAENLSIILAAFVQAEWTDDDEKMFVSVLAEIHTKLYNKLGDVNVSEYSLKLSPAQAIALRLLYLNHVGENKTYVGNRLHQISNEVHKHYC